MMSAGLLGMRLPASSLSKLCSHVGPRCGSLSARASREVWRSEFSGEKSLSLMQRASTVSCSRIGGAEAGRLTRNPAGPLGVAASSGKTGSRGLSSRANCEEVEAKQFLLTLGYEEDVADGMISALKSPSSGITEGQLFTFIKTLAGRWEIGEDAGLVSLAKSVEQELATQRGKQVVSFTVKVPHHNTEFQCEGFEGMSLKDIAEHGQGKGASQLAEYIECACSGVMACSTCHVVVDPDWFDTLGGDPQDAEQDMIDLAYEPTDTSRLGCQIRLEKSMEGFVVSVPAGANNIFDHIPFE